MVAELGQALESTPLARVLRRLTFERWDAVAGIVHDSDVRVGSDRRPRVPRPLLPFGVERREHQRHRAGLREH
ncbi:MAG TPA: hypothetical protein PLS46_12660, partial [Microthrixaceae bacterium]|nr:hypothetical protein [Microthrixaceae bacterium]